MAQPIGIIGGADGPTAIFVTADPVTTVLSAVLAAAIAIVLLKLILKK